MPTRLFLGALFGEVGCLLGEVRHASIVADVACELQVLPKKAMTELMVEYEDFADDMNAAAVKSVAGDKNKVSCWVG